MNKLNKPNFRSLPALSYDEMRGIKGGYTPGCTASYVCIDMCTYNGACSICCRIA